MLSAFTACPGLFYTTPAQDGILSRMRIPGGILDRQQCRAIADIADQFGGGYVNITNRANLQLREIRQEINIDVLKHLQVLGLGASNPFVDHIRNIMTSPTAGIDPQELIDTRPLVQGWNKYILENPHLAKLPAKFSVCFDGGGQVSVGDRLNDIMFAAVVVDGKIYFRLYLSKGAKGEAPKDMGILLLPDECLPVLIVLADVYLDHLDTNSHRQQRLREVLNNLGWENYLQEVSLRLNFPLLHRCSQGRDRGLNTSTPTVSHQHIGIHRQRQSGLFYIGVVLPLGRLESWQMRGLADLSKKYGDRDTSGKISTLRLTPWQNVLLTHIPQQSIANVVSEITLLGLDISTSNIKSSLVACSGKRGCAASATDTKTHALTLAEYLKTHITLDCPISIHFSGCDKSCAQHMKSDITLLGVNVEVGNETAEAYHIYFGDGGQAGEGDSQEKFGRLVYEYVNFGKLPALIQQMLKVYQSKRLSPSDSFSKFTNLYGIAELKRLFNQNLEKHKIPNLISNA